MEDRCFAHIHVENLISKVCGFPAQHIWENTQCEILDSCPDNPMKIKIFSKVEEEIETEVEFNVKFSVRTSIIESLR